MRFRIFWWDGAYKVNVSGYQGGEVVTLDEVEALERKQVALWECPDCCFAFDARHTNASGGGYSCPVCAEVELERRLAIARAALESIAKDPHASYEQFGRANQCSTGVVDGHHCAANRATKALAQLDTERAQPEEVKI